MAKYTKAEQDESRQRLFIDRQLTPGSLVYTNLKRRSSSGMTRHISVHLVRNGVIIDITRDTARLLGYKISDDTGGLVVGGAGMDMGFHVVYSLSRALYPDGHPCIGQGCPSNDHTNDFGDLSRRFESEHGDEYDNTQEGRTAYCVARSKVWDATEAERYASTRIHRDGGYALRQTWL